MITQRGLFPMLKPPVNCYVIAGEEGLVFDAGYGDRRSLRHFMREFRGIEALCRSRGTPFNVRRILASHSHGDHFCGMPKLSRALGLEILMTGPMARTMTSMPGYIESYHYDSYDNDLSETPRPLKTLARLLRPAALAYYWWMFGFDFVQGPYTVIQERGEIRINGKRWMVFPSPGHSEDHISLYDPLKGVLFAGDNVLRTVTTWLGPPKSDLRKYIASMKELLALPGLRLVLSSHGKPVEEPVRRIEEIIEWRKTRTVQVYEIIRDSRNGARFGEILRRLYPRRQFMKRFLAEGWITITLYCLEKEGAVKREARNGTVVFVAKPWSGCDRSA
jgi:glyoxylase-like metal-dependent hydrolase (beta-lactamase superfamily II)